MTPPKSALKAGRTLATGAIPRGVCAALHAFTRLECVILVASLTLMSAVVLQAPALTRPRSEQVTCLNNLRQIGRALELWGEFKQDRCPWQVPFQDGGLSSAGNQGPLPAWSGQVRNVWFHFLWLSNDLVRPMLAACPSDRGVKVARTWSPYDPDAGLPNGNFQHRAVSYFLALDVVSDSSRSVLSGDRNLKTNGVSACAVFPGMGSVTAEIIVRPTPSTQWLPAVHGDTGNLLFADGQVQQVSTRGLIRAFDSPGDNGSTHLLTPLR